MAVDSVLLFFLEKKNLVFLKNVLTNVLRNIAILFWLVVCNLPFEKDWSSVYIAEKDGQYKDVNKTTKQRRLKNRGLVGG